MNLKDAIKPTRRKIIFYIITLMVGVIIMLQVYKGDGDLLKNNLPVVVPIFLFTLIILYVVVCVIVSRNDEQQAIN